MKPLALLCKIGFHKFKLVNWRTQPGAVLCRFECRRCKKTRRATMYGTVAEGFYRHELAYPTKRKSGDV